MIKPIRFLKFEEYSTYLSSSNSFFNNKKLLTIIKKETLGHAP